ncbi:NAD(P)/FAD-dependent oxidoreductase [Burkholderiaceae bacterium FT117]|uniref:NAD(P)/FAD-dependent oxidoreductase n=1 Tax=Zeimonas sediminis TaxID=2944268 RepID=UPI0023431D66|nr:FAD/NAD(P)-binding oxidoreductase [Zeimonas sediminis]MCM5569679.1 NAD(P)/FAD-dependent oxidoreductase [Zeimonas sediminis]
MKHVIIGNGPAGVVAAETLRKHRPKDEIVMIGSEPHPPYSRMAIPYLLIGNIDERGTLLRKDEDHFDRLAIRQVTGRVTGIDTEARKVALSDGTQLDYDRALIASGSYPVSPPIPGLESPFVHPCWTLHDARNITQLAGKGARVLQMGAGFIGCIILEALALRGVKLTVVEMGDRMVPRMMGPAAGTMIRNWCVEKGVTVYTGTRVESLEPGDKIRANFSNGKSEEFDLVIQATGVKPSIGFLSGSPIKCLQGVLVDERQMTSVEGVYAAGDCAEAYDPVSGKTIVSAIQPNAVDQAYVAAMNMAGRRAVSRGVTQINVLDTLGLISTSFGNWQGVPGGDHAELVDERNYRYLRLEFDGDVMVGANSLGMTEHVGVLRNLVENGVKLGAWKDELLKDPTRLMEAYLASAQAQEQWQGPARGTMKH